MVPTTYTSQTTQDAREKTKERTVTGYNRRKKGWRTNKRVEFSFVKPKAGQQPGGRTYGLGEQDTQWTNMLNKEEESVSKLKESNSSSFFVLRSSLFFLIRT